jgi:hypothetical protein
MSDPAAPAPTDLLDDFVELSAILTGIAPGQLRPFLDTHGTAQTYLDHLTAKAPSGAAALMTQYARTRTLPPEQVAQRLLGPSSEVAWIARATMLMWLLGSWYEPSALEAFAAAPDRGPPAFVVISSDAYTQGWAWRIGQAHPMGYSDLRFGYWNAPPLALDAYVKGQ